MAEQLLHYDFFDGSVIALFAFIAGFIDAVVGGGGLIQFPILLIQFPKNSLPFLMGTNKIAAFLGTTTAAVSYAKRITFQFPLLIVLSITAFIASYLGAGLISYIDSKALKPFILVLLIVMAIYTFNKKDLGQEKTKQIEARKQIIYGIAIALVVGFYDGFFGPGTGSFLVLGFVLFLGLDFLHASAYAKFVNCITNIGALSLFIAQGNFDIKLALIMAVFNVSGNLLGTKMALKKGNEFVRLVFLIVVVLLILRYGYDVLS